VPAAAAAAAAHPAASLAEELAAVKQRIADVQKEIEEAKENRKACVPGDDLWKEYSNEIKQLRDEKALLLKKEEQLRDELKRKELEHANAARPGTSNTHH
jgi:chromosome segregation ATPase